MGANRRQLRLVAGAAFALLLTIPVIFYVLAPTSSGGVPPVAIGGPFRLTTQDGTMLTEADLKGRPFAVFFGFTHCPEVCPTTLWEISEALKALGPKAEGLKVLFVSVDPERDTPELLKRYLQSFDPRIIGLTGSNADIEAIAKAYRVYWRKVPTQDGDYTMDHTATVYLMDGTGAFAGTVSYQEQSEVLIAKLGKLLSGERL